MTSSAAAEQQQQHAIDPELSKLFELVQEKLQATRIGGNRWYIVLLACMVAGPDPEAASQLYLYLISKPDCQTSTARQALVRRLREVLIKSISVVGVCKPIEAVLAIAKVERDEDKDYSCSREGWQCDQANYDRGMEWYGKIYAGNQDDTMNLFRAHQDIGWISKNITYGFYLGDRQILDDMDTEMVVLPAIMSQNLPLETGWHIRGTRRIGVSNQDTKVLWDTIQTIAKHFGVNLNKVPTVDEIEDQV
ncbi:hypothetical protein GGR57DRAFT_424011 [Xylariaceae sp. FL1272]|nr:hypothetical protein GGR57DRAFT_424011 [Xylariaceae sp. FL1272]